MTEAERRAEKEQQAAKKKKAAEAAAAEKAAAKKAAAEAAAFEKARAKEAKEQQAEAEKARRNSTGGGSSSSSNGVGEKAASPRRSSLSHTISWGRIERHSNKAEEKLAQSRLEQLEAKGEAHEAINAKAGGGAAAREGLDGERRPSIVDVSDEPEGRYEDPSLPSWLRAWRGNNGSDGGGGGPSAAAELATDCGSTGDCLAMSDDGDTLISIGGDGDAASVSVFSAGQGTLLKSFHGHTDKVCCVAAHHGIAASGGVDRCIRLWSLTTGECTGIVEGCQEKIYGLALRGELLLSGEAEGGGGGGGKARLWLLDGKRTRAAPAAVFSEHTGHVWSVALGKEVGVSASHDGTVKVWPLVGGNASIATLTHPDWVCSVSLDGDMIATGCGDGRVRLWSLESQKCTRTLDHNGGKYFDGKVRVRVGNRSPVFSVRLIGNSIVSGGQDQNVRVWSLNGECVATLAHGANVRGLAGGAAGGFVASVGGKPTKKLVVWRAGAVGAPPSTAPASSSNSSTPTKKTPGIKSRR